MTEGVLNIQTSFCSYILHIEVYGFIISIRNQMLKVLEEIQLRVKSPSDHVTSKSSRVIARKENY